MEKNKPPTEINLLKKERRKLRVVAVGRRLEGVGDVLAVQQDENTATTERCQP